MSLVPEVSNASSVSMQYKSEVSRSASVPSLQRLPVAATVAQPGNYSSVAEKMMMNMGYKSGSDHFCNNGVQVQTFFQDEEEDTVTRVHFQLADGRI
jgi:hypothetical protein